MMQRAQAETATAVGPEPRPRKGLLSSVEVESCGPTDAQAVETRTLASVWRGLLSGELEVCGIHAESEQTIAVLLERRLESASELTVGGRHFELFERMLEGCSLKVIGAEFGVATSSAWQKLSRTARAIGLSGRMTAIPVLLAQLCYASKLDSPIAVPTIRIGDGRFALSMPRVEIELSRHLTPAEVDVCALALEGLSHAKIAERRRTSRRTIANQLASAFRRFGVSGRIELLAAVARLQIGAQLTGSTLDGERPCGSDLSNVLPLARVRRDGAEIARS